jgi:hypothetical protein
MKSAPISHNTGFINCQFFQKISKKSISPILGVTSGVFYYYSRESINGPLSLLDRRVELILGGIAIALIVNFALQKIFNKNLQKKSTSDSFSHELSITEGQKQASVRTPLEPLISQSTSTPQNTQAPSSLNSSDTTRSESKELTKPNSANLSNASMPIGAGGNGESRGKNSELGSLVKDRPSFLDYSNLLGD